MAYAIAHPATRYRTTFVPSLIGLALLEIEGSRAIHEKLATFLLAQRSSDWAWNYWERGSTHARQNPYPDDLDDTFLALLYLWNQDKTLLTPEVMARVANLLFVTEVAPGGPYVTWVADETADPAWRDVDPIVNGNIASFLVSQGVDLPRVEELVETALNTDMLVSPYYPDVLPGVYLTARWYRGEYAARLREMILARRTAQTQWGSAHETALAISALLRLGHPAEDLDAAVVYLDSQQKANGSWPAGAMYIVDVAYGSPVLTTALCLEAKALHRKARHREESVSKGAPDPAYDGVIKGVRAVIDGLSRPDLRGSASAILERIIAQDTDHQIVLIPRLIQQAIGAHVLEEVLHGLSMTSVWGWMAYTALDDFLDGEGDPKLLPAAVFAHRCMVTNAVAVLPRDTAFQLEVTDILNRLDGANSWEAAHCRGVFHEGVFTIKEIPDYGDLWQLADRSLGYVIPVVGVLYAAGYGPESTQMTAMRQFFRHYLIARQLNDDAHDWQDDLQRGHVNAVAAMVLQKWCEADKNRQLARGIRLEEHGDRLRLIIWEEVIAQVCIMIDQEIKAARQVMKVLPKAKRELLYALLAPLEQASKKALHARDDALEFIAKL